MLLIVRLPELPGMPIKDYILYTIITMVNCSSVHLVCILQVLFIYLKTLQCCWSSTDGPLISCISGQEIHLLSNYLISHTLLSTSEDYIDLL